MQVTSLKGILKMSNMQIREAYYTSYFYKISKHLFIDVKGFPVSKSIVGKALQKIYYPYVSEICLALSVFLFWYEGLLAKYLPILTSHGIASGLLVIGLLFAKKDRIVFGKAQFWYLGFLTLSLLSALFAIMRGIDGTLLISGWLLFLQFGLAIFIAQSIKEKRRILKGLVFVSVPLSIVGIYQFVFHIKTSALWLSSFERGIDTRAFAFFGSPNVLGILLSIMAILTLGFYLKERKIYYLAITFLDILAVGLTFSRSAWLGLTVGVLIIILVYKPKLLLFSPVVFLLLLFPQVRERITAALSGQYLTDSALDGRIWSYINGIHIFKQYPFLGAGPGSYGGQLAAQSASPVYLQSIQNGYTALYFTDNQYLEILVQNGVLGTIAFLGFIICVFVALIDKFREKRDILMLSVVGSFVCFLVSGLFANVLEFGAVAVPMGIILGSSISED